MLDLVYKVFYVTPTCISSGPLIYTLVHLTYGHILKEQNCSRQMLNRTDNISLQLTIKTVFMFFSCI